LVDCAHDSRAKTKARAIKMGVRMEADSIIAEVGNG
jgi:hypothetical protein